MAPTEAMEVDGDEFDSDNPPSDDEDTRFHTSPISPNEWMDLPRIMPRLDPADFAPLDSGDVRAFTSTMMRRALVLRDVLQAFQNQLKILLGRTHNLYQANVDEMARRRGALMTVTPRLLRNSLEEFACKLGSDTDYHDAADILEDLARVGMTEIAGHALSTHIPLNETYETVFMILRRISHHTEGFPDINNFMAMDDAAKRMIDQEGEGDVVARMGRLNGECRKALEDAYLSLCKFDEAEDTFHQLQMKLQRALNLGFDGRPGQPNTKTNSTREQVIEKLLEFALDDKNMLMYVKGGLYPRVFRTAMAVSHVEQVRSLYFEHVLVGQLQDEIGDMFDEMEYDQDIKEKHKKTAPFPGYKDDLVRLQDIQRPHPEKELEYERRKRDEDNLKDLQRRAIKKILARVIKALASPKTRRSQEIQGNVR
ncbi:hypothetical protein M409DRAFT_16765 [Zasmidium cellare ATCC 36951]|uniref:Uncharacterized protein n=1 Tax=Zasmidium cellare ATCC 36951 TaxID=1080233 RepID=A0A6A6D0V2_ZASCE|nr:uncharacterized protein M409DRAFT_16765 [Zasmidium cellare ATCC 36951]KAF2172805.1 hypothetical protein M409DRAFT_16765 [Zasmidium cellare ATCC 36951]